MGGRGHVDTALKGSSVAGGMGAASFIEGAALAAVTSYSNVRKGQLEVANSSTLPLILTMQADS